MAFLSHQCTIDSDVAILHLVCRPHSRIPRQVHHKRTFIRFSQILKHLERTLSVILL
ncbi:hypothetical protein L218DRAFT_306402 [Marasmius fiardii PR-910]|nr:hypothetical protein L218DRAFT_306402 [Marasmius fiardii PR-910]